MEGERERRPESGEIGGERGEARPEGERGDSSWAEEGEDAESESMVMWWWCAGEEAASPPHLPSRAPVPSMGLNARASLSFSFVGGQEQRMPTMASRRYPPRSRHGGPDRRPISPSPRAPPRRGRGTPVRAYLAGSGKEAPILFSFRRGLAQGGVGRIR